MRLIRASHKNLGVFLALFLILISFTGILLNHTESLALNNYAAPGFIAARYYTVTPIEGFKLDQQHYYALAGDLMVNQQKLTSCEQLNGVITAGNQRVALCDNELILLTTSNELIERIGTALSMPGGATKIAEQSNQVYLLAGTRTIRFDLETLEQEDYLGSPVNWVQTETIPRDLVLAESISWQQFILDVHSGVFLGNPGKWFTDLIAIFSIAMAVSGLMMWRDRR